MIVVFNIDEHTGVERLYNSLPPNSSLVFVSGGSLVRIYKTQESATCTLWTWLIKVRQNSLTKILFDTTEVPNMGMFRELPYD